MHTFDVDLLNDGLAKRLVNTEMQEANVDLLSAGMDEQLRQCGWDTADHKFQY